jgi:hypothetical protein
MIAIRALSIVGLTFCLLGACSKNKSTNTGASGGKQKAAPSMSVFFVGEDDEASVIAAETARVFRLDLRGQNKALYKEVNTVLEDNNPPGKLALEEGKKLYKQGRELLDQLKPEDAFPILNDAWASYASAYSYLTDEEKMELKELCLDLAKSSFLSRKKQAVSPETALLRVFLLDPSATFDARRLSPRMEKVFADAKAAKDSAAKTTLKVESAPSFSEVYINGIFAGVTPIEIPDVATGENFISVRKDGYEKYSNVVTVTPNGKTQEVALLSQLQKGKLLDEVIKESRASAGNIKPSKAMQEFGSDPYFLDLVAFGDAETLEDGKVKIVVYLYDLRRLKQERINRREIIIDPKSAGREGEYSKLADKIFLSEVRDSKGKLVTDKNGKVIEIPVDLSGEKKEKAVDVCEEQVKLIQLANGNQPVDKEELCGIKKPPIYKRKWFRISAASLVGVVALAAVRTIIFVVATPELDCDPDKDGNCAGVDLDGNGDF